MIRTAVILILAVAGGGQKEVQLPETYASMEACQKAKAGVVEQYQKENPDADVRRSQCRNL